MEGGVDEVRGYLCNEAFSCTHEDDEVACSGDKYEIYIYIYIEREAGR